MGEEGFEPSRPFGHTDLNRARLPFRHPPEVCAEGNWPIISKFRARLSASSQVSTSSGGQAADTIGGTQGREVPRGSPTALRAAARGHGRRCLCTCVQVGAAAGRGRQRRRSGRWMTGPPSWPRAARWSRTTSSSKSPSRSSGCRCTQTAWARSSRIWPGSTRRSRGTPCRAGADAVRGHPDDHGHVQDPVRCDPRHHGRGRRDPPARQRHAEPAGGATTARPRLLVSGPEPGPDGQAAYLRADHAGDPARPGHGL